MSFPALGIHNPRLTLARALARPGGGRDLGLCLLEGVRLVGDALQAGVTLEWLLVAQDLRGEALALASRAAALGVEVRALDSERLERLSPTRTSQGILAAARRPAWEVGQVLSGDLVLALLGLQDPGNVGALLRTALGAGASGCLLAGCADPFGPRAVRASAGAALRLPSRVVSLEELEQALSVSGHALVVAEAHGGRPLREAILPSRVALVLGGEAHGVPARIQQRAALALTIPLQGGCESLNVAAAGALILFEARRQLESRGGAASL